MIPAIVPAVKKMNLTGGNLDMDVVVQLWNDGGKWARSDSCTYVFPNLRASCIRATP